MMMSFITRYQNRCDDYRVNRIFDDTNEILHPRLIDNWELFDSRRQCLISDHAHYWHIANGNKPQVSDFRSPSTVGTSLAMQEQQLIGAPALSSRIEH